MNPMVDVNFERRGSGSPLVLVHGILSGTDSHTVWAGALYWFAGGSLLLLLFYRIMVTVGVKKTQRA